MPTYLCHGFRWHRDAIRFFIIVQDIDDAAPDWVLAPGSSDALLAQFYELFDFLPYRGRRQRESGDDPVPEGSSDVGDCQGKQAEPDAADRTHIEGLPFRHGGSSSRQAKTGRRDESSTALATLESSDLPPDVEELPPSKWSAVQLLEEFNPADLSVVSGQWAYITDHAVRIDTSAPVIEEMLRYNSLEESREYKAMNGPGDETGQWPNTTAEAEQTGWLEKLRDKLQADEPIRWYVVVCGDEDRQRQDSLGDRDGDGDGDGDEDRTIGATSEGQEQRHKPPPLSSETTAKRGDVEVTGGGADVEFRLADLLDSKAQRCQGPKADWNTMLEKPPPFMKKKSPLTAGAAHNGTFADAGARQKTPRISGLRRLFIGRRRVGLKRTGSSRVS